jgi:hypothetical protein
MVWLIGFLDAYLETGKTFPVYKIMQNVNTVSRLVEKHERCSFRQSAINAATLKKLAPRRGTSYNVVAHSVNRTENLVSVRINQESRPPTLAVPHLRNL